MLSSLPFSFLCIFLSLYPSSCFYSATISHNVCLFFSLSLPIPHFLCLPSLLPFPLFLLSFLTTMFLLPFHPPSFTHLLCLCAVMAEMQAEGEESAELNRDAQLGQHNCLRGCVYVCVHVCICASVCMCVCVCDRVRQKMRVTKKQRQKLRVRW